MEKCHELTCPMKQIASFRNGQHHRETNADKQKQTNSDKDERTGNIEITSKRGQPSKKLARSQTDTPKDRQNTLDKGKHAHTIQCKKTKPKRRQRDKNPRTGPA